MIYLWIFLIIIIQIKQLFMDESELKYAEWVYREDIVLQPSDYSLTNEMMKIFKENKINIGR